MIHLGLCSPGCIATWNMIHLGFVFCWVHCYVEQDSPGFVFFWGVHYYVEHDSPGFVFSWVHCYVEHDSPGFCVLLGALLRGT
jgi:hypothetical protein